MRLVVRTTLPIFTLIVTGLIPLMFSQPAYSREDGYLLLELDGYKVKWGAQHLGVGATISYAFADESLYFENAHNCRELVDIDGLLGPDISREILVRETAAAFRVWERAAALSFREVDDVRDADIILGAQGQPRGQAFANVSYSNESGAEEGVRTIEQSLVCLNPEHKWKVGFDGDENVNDIRYTLIHEIGHAIGLDHPGPSGQVMAFRYTEAYNDLQPGDLRGVRLLYGRAMDKDEPVGRLASRVAHSLTGEPEGGFVRHPIVDHFGGDEDDVTTGDLPGVNEKDTASLP
jgi:hypothetical protein